MVSEISWFGILARAVLFAAYILFSFGLWRGRINSAAFVALLSGAVLVFFLISIPFEQASRLVVAGVEIDSRIEKAEKILARIKEGEKRLMEVETRLSASIKKVDSRLSLSMATLELNRVMEAIEEIKDRIMMNPDSSMSMQPSLMLLESERDGLEKQIKMLKSKQNK